MAGILKKISQILIGFALLGIWACGQAPQVSGVVAISNIETTACQPRQKTIKIRNNNTDEPQRIQGVLFELGTNADKFFKVISVSANGNVKQAVGDLVEEIILPPGGVMEVVVQYNPKETTPNSDEEYHATWLDVFLNGPKLGIMQIEIRGRAPEALPGCSNETTNGRVFEVVGVNTYLSHTGLGEVVVTPLDISTDVQGDFILAGDGDQVSLKPDGWPQITFPLPDGAPLPEINIVLDEETEVVDFSSGSLTFENVILSAPGVGAFGGLTLTTGDLTIDSSAAPNVFGGAFNLTGSDLNESGEMTLVVMAALNEGAVKDVDNVGGGVFGLEIQLKEKK